MKNVALLFMLLISSLCVNAQNGCIIYTDFEPDTMQYVTLDNTWFVDINYDNVNDLKITGYIGFMHFFMGEVFMLNGFECCVSDEDTYLDSDTITWITHDDWFANSSLTGTVPYDGNGYGSYGFRTLIDNNYYYGWMSLWVNLNNPDPNYMMQGRDIYIDKMAFCTIPNYPLRFGQYDLDDVDETYEMPNVNIHPNPTNGTVIISGDNIAKLEVLNTIGQTVIKTEGCNDNITIDMSSQPAGIYFFKTTDYEGRKCTKKVIKK